MAINVGDKIPEATLFHMGEAGPAKISTTEMTSGKKVVIIGSGATAVTLVPAMAEQAEHVVMLQRSPSYLVSRPFKDSIANFLRKILPSSWAYALTRWRNTMWQQVI